MKNQETAPRADSAPLPETAAPEVFGLLRSEIQRALADADYRVPTPIQAGAIPPILEGRDLLGSAQTGTGKTAAFTLPLLHRLADRRRPRPNTPRALILAPTRELAAQISESISTYGRYVRLSHTVIYGGVSQVPQVKALRRGVDILVATPGRLLDLLQQGHVYLDEVECFILDEVDRMLDMGFIPDIQRVLAELPEDRQTLFFSATMAPKVVELANTMVTDPVTVRIAPDKPAVEKIAQSIFFVNQKDKPKLLLDLLDESGPGKVIVFTQMKHVANRLSDKLVDNGVRATAIHGNKSQAARTRALQGFKHGRFRVLVATDVAARGLDVDDVTHVVNYDMPMEAETYVHRIGRTARAGASGEAFSFCSAEERALLNPIERQLKKSVPQNLEHAYHCNKAFHSAMPAPKPGGGGRGGKGGRSGGRGGYNRGGKGQRFSRGGEQRGNGQGYDGRRKKSWSR